MSKASSFIGDPLALKELLIAIRGVRQIQTFGSCYNFAFDDDANGAIVDGEKSKHRLECECGANVFERIGTFGFGAVKLTPEGVWLIRRDLTHGRQRCRGHST